MIGRKALVAFVFVTSALVLASLALPGHVAGADPPARLQVDAELRDDGAWMLRATLTRGDAVQSQQTVEFLQLADFFGERWVPIATGLTDAAGVASQIYSPTSNGVQRLVARYVAADGTFESDPLEITVSGAVPAIPGEAPVLPIIRAWAFPVGAAILFLVWLVLAVILLRAVIGIARSTPVRATSAAPTREGPTESIPQQTSSTE